MEKTMEKPGTRRPIETTGSGFRSAMALVEPKGILSIGELLKGRREDVEKAVPRLTPAALAYFIEHAPADNEFRIPRFIAIKRLAARYQGTDRQERIDLRNRNGISKEIFLERIMAMNEIEEDADSESIPRRNAAIDRIHELTDREMLRMLSQYGEPSITKVAALDRLEILALQNEIRSGALRVYGPTYM